MVIGRSEDRDNPWDRLVLRHHCSVWNPIRVTHLGQRSTDRTAKAGHMTATDQTVAAAQPLQAGGRPHMPVPARPQTNQLSTISQSPIGSRKKAPSKACPGPGSGGGLASGGVMKAPSLTQLEASQPLANDQVPLSTYPPSTGIALPVGAKHAQVNGSASPSQTSRWASIGKWAIDRPLETAPLTAQPVEAQAAEIVIAILSATSPSYSKPPNSFGRQVRNSSASLILSTMWGSTLRLRSVSSASPRISGAMRRARLISSAGVGMAKRRIAAVVTRENPFCLRAPSRTSKMRLSDYRDNEKSCVSHALNATE